MEKFLETKGLLVEAEDYVEKAIQDTDDLQYDYSHIHSYSL